MQRTNNPACQSPLGTALPGWQQVMRRQSHPLTMIVLLSIIAGTWTAEIGWAQGRRKPEEVLAQLTEDVDMYTQLVQRGSDPMLRPAWERELAWSLYRRGELLAMTLKKPAEGVRDLDRAAEFYRRTENAPGQDAGRDTPPTLAGVLFFRGLALRELGRAEEALTSLTEAIGMYEKCVQRQGMEHLETVLARFYRNRGEIAACRDATAKDAVQDFDRAITIYTKWSKKEGCEQDFQKPLQELQALRDKAAKR